MRSRQVITHLYGNPNLFHYQRHGKKRVMLGLALAATQLHFDLLGVALIIRRCSTLYNINGEDVISHSGGGS